MKSKEEIRRELEEQVKAFLRQGGRIQKLPARKIPINRKVTA